MARLMSVAFTEQAVRDRIKTVTRRKGWWKDKNGRRLIQPGDRITLCRMVLGRKKGEPLERICDVEIVEVRREQFGLIYDEPDGVAREGFTDLSPAEFIKRFFAEAQGISPWCEITRIEWRYLDDQPAQGRSHVLNEVTNIDTRPELPDLYSSYLGSHGTVSTSVKVSVRRVPRGRRTRHPRGGRCMAKALPQEYADVLAKTRGASQAGGVSEMRLVKENQ